MKTIHRVLAILMTVLLTFQPAMSSFATEMLTKEEMVECYEESEDMIPGTQSEDNPEEAAPEEEKEAAPEEEEEAAPEEEEEAAPEEEEEAAPEEEEEAAPEEEEEAAPEEEEEAALEEEEEGSQEGGILKETEVALLGDLEVQYFTMTSETSFTVLSNNGKGWVTDGFQEDTGTIEYQAGEGAWTEWDGTEVSAAKTGNLYSLRFRGSGNTYISIDRNSNNHTWQVSGNAVSVSGNIMTLLDWESPEDVVMHNSCFNRFLAGNTAVTDISGLEFPAMVLSRGCYGNMFNGCTGLTDISEIYLPAEVLEYQCYMEMFKGCSNITKAMASLDAMTLAHQCYDGMFQECSKLVEVPSLPATEMARACYAFMFEDCISLEAPPEMAAQNTAFMCFGYMFDGCKALKTAPALDMTVVSERCYEYMFRKCESLEEAPSLPAESMEPYCYEYMFCACKKLKSAPELPAETLATDCYYNMFASCESLEEVPELPAENLAERCYGEMFRNCPRLKRPADLSHVVSTAANSCCRMYYTTASGIHLYKTGRGDSWRLPETVTGDGAENWCTDMFRAGVIVDDPTRTTPEQGVTYYFTGPVHKHSSGQEFSAEIFTEADLINLFEEGGTGYLKNSIDLTEVLEAEADVSLCLNGNWINGAAQAAAAIKILEGVTLSVYDEEVAEDTWYGSIRRGQGSGCAILNQGTFNLYGGNIRSWGKNTDSAGIENDGGAFNMTDGWVRESKYGIKNTAGSVRLGGGQISENGTGIYLPENGGTVLLENSIDISGNETANLLFITDAEGNEVNRITVSGTLTGRIGVCVQKPDGSECSSFDGAITNACADGNLSKFSCDAEKYFITYDTDHIRLTKAYLAFTKEPSADDPSVETETNLPEAQTTYQWCREGLEAITDQNAQGYTLESFTGAYDREAGCWISETGNAVVLMADLATGTNVSYEISDAEEEMAFCQFMMMRVAGGGNIQSYEASGEVTIAEGGTYLIAALGVDAQENFVNSRLNLYKGGFIPVSGETSGTLRTKMAGTYLCRATAQNTEITVTESSECIVLGEAGSCTVRFDYESEDTETRTVPAGTEIELPTVSKEGYIFKGWYAADEGEEPVIAEGTYTVTGNITFRAVFAETKKIEGKNIEISTVSGPLKNSVSMTEENEEDLKSVLQNLAVNDIPENLQAAVADTKKNQLVQENPAVTDILFGLDTALVDLTETANGCKLTYSVKPWYQLFSGGTAISEKTPLENAELNGKEISFRLAVPASVSRKYAKTTHTTEGGVFKDLKYYLVSKQDAEGKTEQFVEAETTEFSLFTLEFTNEQNHSEESGEDTAEWWNGAGSGWLLKPGTNEWYFIRNNQPAKGWYYEEEDKKWYYLDPQTGIMKTGWVQINGKWYYLNPTAAEPTWSKGADGKWHFSSAAEARPYGSMYCSEKTPDGYAVGTDGAWLAE